MPPPLAGVLFNFIIHLLFVHVYLCVCTTVHAECKRELDPLLPFCGSLGLNSGLGSRGLDDWARRFVCLFEGFGHLCSYFLRLTFWMLNAGSKDGHVLVFNPNYKPFSRKAKLSCLSCLGDDRFPTFPLHACFLFICFLYWSFYFPLFTFLLGCSFPTDW